MLGTYEEAVKKSRDCIFIEMFYETSDSLSGVLYNIGWCYGMMMKMEQDSQKKKEYKQDCIRYFRQSYSIAKIYKEYNIEKAIDEKRKIWTL